MAAHTSTTTTMEDSVDKDFSSSNCLEAMTPYSLLTASTRGAASTFLSTTQQFTSQKAAPVVRDKAPTPIPETRKSASQENVEAVDLTVVQEGMSCHLEFGEAALPERLAQHLSLEQWSELRSRVDTIVRQMKWNPYRTYLLLAALGSIFLFMIFVLLEDQKGDRVKLDAQLFIILVVQVLALLRLAWGKRREDQRRSIMLRDMDILCREYTLLLWPKGLTVSFGYLDNGEDDDEVQDQIVADLRFYFHNPADFYDA